MVRTSVQQSGNFRSAAVQIALIDHKIDASKRQISSKALSERFDLQNQDPKAGHIGPAKHKCGPAEQSFAAAERIGGPVVLSGGRGELYFHRGECSAAGFDWSAILAERSPRPAVNIAGWEELSGGSPEMSMGALEWILRPEPVGGGTGRRGGGCGPGGSKSQPRGPMDGRGGRVVGPAGWVCWPVASGCGPAGWGLGPGSWACRPRGGRIQPRG